MSPVLIIGAGFAGLAAANALREKGIEALILEARDRCGGRVFSDSSLGIPLDRGAGWIHGLEGNPLAEQARQFQAPLGAVNSATFSIYDRKGQLIPTETLRQFEQSFSGDLSLAKEFAEKAPQDLSLAAALAPFFKARTLTAVSQDLFKRKQGFFEGYIGAGYESLSARHWDHELSLPGAHCVLTQSYAPITQGLAAACSVRFNTVARVVREEKDKVLVLTDRESYPAQAVLVTVPLSLLKNETLRFEPPLAARKQSAIARLGMGLFNVAALKFPRVFWPQDSGALFFTGWDEDSIALFINLWPLNQQPVLLGYSGGEKARRIEGYSDAAIRDKLMRNLRGHFGQSIPAPEASFFTRWSQDPFSRGSYSYLPVGASPEDRETLAEPASTRLFFAGEATMRDYPASTHGAYWSGLRGAERIAEKLLSF